MPTAYAVWVKCPTILGLAVKNNLELLIPFTVRFTVWNEDPNTLGPVVNKNSEFLTPTAKDV